MSLELSDLIFIDSNYELIELPFFPNFNKVNGILLPVQQIEFGGNFVLILKRSSEEKFWFEGEFEIVASEVLDIFLDDNLDGLADKNQPRSLKETLVIPGWVMLEQNTGYTIVLAKPNSVEHQ